ncbi:hypothetical protein [Candidatus Nitrospira bockiana]
MPRTALTVQTPKGPYPGTVSANDLDFTLAAGDVANGNEFSFTGRELIIAQNTDVGAQTITLTSANDERNRKGDINAYSIGAGEFAMFWAGSVIGWDQSGKFHINVSNAGIKLAIIRIPA